MGRFDHRKYSVLYALGKSKRAALYCRSTWQFLLPSLDPIVRAAVRTPEGVRCDQIDRRTGDLIRFGRLRWNARSHARWTHDCDGPALSEIRFVGMDLWAPIWTVCEKEDLAPDVFIQLVDIETIKRQSLLVAVCDDVATDDTADQLNELARACSDVLEGPVLATTKRYWGRSVLNDFRGSMQDYWSQVAHVLRAGADGADIASLPGRWQPVVPAMTG